MLSLLVAPTLVAIAIGVARGGSIGRIADARLRLPFAILGIALLQVLRARGLPPGDQLLGPHGDTVGDALVFGGTAAWGAFNVVRGDRRLRLAILLFIAGGAANALAIHANDGMPYSARAAEIAGAPARTETGYRAIDATTEVRALADIVPIPGTGTVISAGDIAIMIGTFCGLVALMGTRPIRRGPTPLR